MNAKIFEGDQPRDLSTYNPNQTRSKTCETLALRIQPYTYNDTFANKIKAEIDRLLEAKSIYKIKHTICVLLVVMVLKKNGKMIVCINLKKFNAITISNICIPYQS